jgi:hypothetical protein
MKSQKEIYEALLSGKKLKYKESNAIIFLGNNGMINGCTAWSFSMPSDFEIYEEPKPKKRYWIWRLKKGSWYRPMRYLDDKGRDTSGDKQFSDWDETEKIKIESDFIEV